MGDPSPLATTNAGIEEGEGVTTEGGMVTVAGDGRVLYEPPAGFSGIDSFLYSAQDVVGHGCSAEVIVDVAAIIVEPTEPTDPTDPTDPTNPGGPGGGGNGSGGYGNGSGYGDGNLARTGTDAAALLSVAAVLVAIGGGLVALAALRRRPHLGQDLYEVVDEADLALDAGVAEPVDLVEGRGRQPGRAAPTTAGRTGSAPGRRARPRPPRPPGG